MLFLYKDINKKYELKELCNKKYVYGIALIIDCYLSYKFYYRFLSSQTIEQITSFIGISKNVFLLIASIIGFIVSFMFIYSICIALTEFLCKKADVSNKTIRKALNICVIMLLVGIVLLIIFSFTKYFWSDEVFTFDLINKDFFEMIDGIKNDVHPVLYFILTKLFVEVTSVVFPNLNMIYIEKLFSLLPMLFMIAICLTIVKKEFGVGVSIVSSLCFIGAPNFMNYALEIRMYSWGMFFVFVSYLSAYYVNKDINNNRNWIIFVILSLCASYTHYYAVVAVIFIYLYVLYVSIKQKQLIKWIISVISIIVLYIPGFIFFNKQVLRVYRHFWIKEITLKEIKNYFKFIFNNKETFAVLVIIYLLLKNKKEKYENVGIMMPFFVMMVGIIASLLMRPVFVSRHMIVALPCLWFALTLLIFNNKKIIYILLV